MGKDTTKLFHNPGALNFGDDTADAFCCSCSKKRSAEHEVVAAEPEDEDVTAEAEKNNQSKKKIDTN